MRAVGQRFASMGTKDIRKNISGGIDIRIQRQLKSYKKDDSPPSRVEPVPITIILYILHRAYGSKRVADSQAVADVITIAFFFLLRPGEYTGTTTDDAAFSLADVTLFLQDKELDPMTAPLQDIEAATAVKLTFTTQKNGTRNESILHGRSDDALCCPTKAVIQRNLHHRHHNSKSTTSLASYYNPRRNWLVAVKAKDVTGVLRHAAAANRSVTGINPKDISARSLRAGGAMALLCGDVDHNLIQMLGCWHSDAMMRCLHLEAQPIMSKFAAKMFNHGKYSFNPDKLVPVKNK